ncbi:MAG: hypothetical protein U0271_19915 [Polyangiaceae bacterium]
MRLRFVVLGLLATSCGGASESTTTVVDVASAPSATVASTPRGRAPDLLRCPLTARVYQLGEANDGVASAPVIVGDGFAAAFTHSTPIGAELQVQRVRSDGALEAPVVVRQGVATTLPFVAGDGAMTYVAVTNGDGVTEAVALDPATAKPSATSVQLDKTVLQDLDLGPRGLVRLDDAGDRYRLVRQGSADVELPAPKSSPIPREQLVASGPSAELVLLRTIAGVRLETVGATAPVLSPVLFTERSGIWTEASVAAGPAGFLLVRTGPGISDLETYRVDAAGAVARPTSIPADANIHVRRYPRAAPLGDGWMVSYWDGTGPSMLRLDASGAALGPAMELRSGDERGGHTDARMVASDDAIAVTWTVDAPLFNHGMPEEQPERPGPTMAILRCGEKSRG